VYISSGTERDVRRPLKFFDIAVGKSFTTAEYQVVEVAFRFPHGVERRPMAVAVSPYTGNRCYSFAPRRSEIKAAPLNHYF